MSALREKPTRYLRQDLLGDLRRLTDQQCELDRETVDQTVKSVVEFFRKNPFSHDGRWLRIGHARIAHFEGLGNRWIPVLARLPRLLVLLNDLHARATRSVEAMKEGQSERAKETRQTNDAVKFLEGELQQHLEIFDALESHFDRDIVLSREEWEPHKKVLELRREHLAKRHPFAQKGRRAVREKGFKKSAAASSGSSCEPPDDAAKRATDDA